MVAQANLKSACLIPARIGSTRFPRKPLAIIAGRTMIETVATNAADAFGVNDTFVVTDSLEIHKVVEAAGLQSIMTTKEFETGTDRIASVVSQIGQGYSWLFNVQGDEPALTSDSMVEFVQKTYSTRAEVTNAFLRSRDAERIKSPNTIKMAITSDGRLAYASRSVIPALASSRNIDYALQVCIYGFRPEALRDFGGFERQTSSLEANENIEILRFLDMGVSVEMLETSSTSHPVDVPEDLLIAERIMLGGK